MHYNCDTIVVIMVSLYHLSKSCFYGVLIARLQVAFLMSALKYGTKTIWSMFGCVALYTAFVCIGSPFIVYGVWLDAPVSWCHVHIVEGGISPLCILVWIVMDVVASVVLCYMFIRPIKQVCLSKPVW